MDIILSRWNFSKADYEYLLERGHDKCIVWDLLDFRPSEKFLLLAIKSNANECIESLIDRRKKVSIDVFDAFVWYGTDIPDVFFKRYTARPRDFFLVIGDEYRSKLMYAVTDAALLSWFIHYPENTVEGIERRIQFTDELIARITPSLDLSCCWRYPVFHNDYMFDKFRRKFCSGMPDHIYHVFKHARTYRYCNQQLVIQKGINQEEFKRISNKGFYGLTIDHISHPYGIKNIENRLLYNTVEFYLYDIERRSVLAEIWRMPCGLLIAEFAVTFPLIRLFYRFLDRLLRR